jgi:general L-amino acid transport system substrate-binding protein
MVFALALVAAACGDSDSDETTETTAAPVETTQASTETTGGGDAGQATGDSTLDTVQARGTLICGVSGTAVAFSETQADGSVSGFDADFCRYLAAVVTGSADNVEFRALTAAERFEALKSGEVDVLFRNTTFTQSRDSDVGIDFGPTTYYDGQQLMGERSKGFSEESTLADIDGAVLCTNAGTTTEKNVTEGAAQVGATITLETVEQFPEAMEKFQAGQCDLVTTDGSGLVGNKATLDTNDEWVIFPASPISKEPLGPAYRQNDSQWADVVDWAVFTSIIFDELDVTSANVDAKLAELPPENDPPSELGRLLGLPGEVQSAMGLAPDAFYQAVKQAGNYDEIYARNLNPVGLSREGSLNASFLDFGLVYAPPAR